MKRTLRYLASWFLVAGCLLVVGDVGRAQAPRKIVNPKTGQTHWTGRKPLPPETLKRLADAAKQRHGNLIARLPKATAATYDSRALGMIPPIRDQGQCGSCWCFSGSGVIGVALIKAGQIPNTSNQPSEQYVLDCEQNGGCGGDDNVNPIQNAKAAGQPLDKDYGVAYQASAGRCRSTSSLKLYKISDYGFCTNGGNGVANVQDIKNAIVAYGCVGCGVAAGGGWWNSGTGTDTANGQDIDHDVIIVAWDDTHDNGDGSKGAWIMRNSWGTSWGDKCANTANPNPTEAGYGWMKYGADSIGTEAVWAVAASVKPPNPWVFGKRASLDLPRGDVACCGNQIEVKEHAAHPVLAPQAPVTYNATFTTTSDRQPGSYGSALFGISANLPQMLPQGEYNAVLTKVGQQAKGTARAWVHFDKPSPGSKIILPYRGSMWTDPGLVGDFDIGSGNSYIGGVTIDTPLTSYGAVAIPGGYGSLVWTGRMEAGTYGLHRRQQAKPAMQETWQSFVDTSGKRWYRYDDGVYRDGTWTPRTEDRAQPQSMVQPLPEIRTFAPSVPFGGGFRMMRGARAGGRC